MVKAKAKAKVNSTETMSKREVAKTPERIAYDHIDCGLNYEMSEDWQAAANEYRQAMKAGASGWNLIYSANNNLGYVLVQLGQYEEAEVFCRAAIAIRPEPYNAHKNLGLALQGRGLWGEAAMCFIEATNRNPVDPRAWQLLEHLLRARPNLMKLDSQLAQHVADTRVSLEQNNLIRPPIAPYPLFKLVDIPAEH